MADIIQGAKRLLEGATPGPWKWEERKYRGNSDCHHDWLGSEHGTALVTFDSEEYSSWVEASDSDKLLTAAAPELARALAEETWEYAVQVKIGAKWLFLGRGAGGHSFAKNAFWFDKKEKAQGYPLTRGETAPTRLVRRRVSPPEVIDEEL